MDVVVGMEGRRTMNGNRDQTSVLCPKWLWLMTTSLYGWCVLVPRRYSMVGEVNVVIAGGWVLAAAVLAAVLRGRLRLRHVSWPTLIMLMTSTVLPLTSIIRVLDGSATDLGELWRTLYFAAMLMVSVLLAMCNFAKSTYVRFLKTQCLLSGLSMLFGIVLAVNPSAFGPISSDLRLLSGGEGIFRAHSPFGGPNILGCLGAVVTPIMVYLAGKRAKPAVLVFGFVATVLTGSKTAFLSLLVGLVFQWIVVFPGNPLKPIAISVFTAILVFLSMKRVPRLSQLLAVWSGLQAGGSGRLAVWKQALYLVSQRPIMGWGKDYFLFESWELGVPFLAHNLWLELILDFGILFGLPFAFSVLVCLCRMAHATVKNPRMLGPFGASACAFACATMGDYIYWEPRCIVVFLLFLSSMNGLVRSIIEKPIVKQRMKCS